MKTMIFLASLFVAAHAHAILILPYGHWTLTQVTCSAGAAATPGMTRASRHDVHLLEGSETFESATLNRTGWNVAKGEIVVDHAAGTVCFETTDRLGGAAAEPAIEPAVVCARYAKPADDKLVLIFAGSWAHQSCPLGQDVEFHFNELPH